VHVADTMAFMFETRTVIRPTRLALEVPQLQGDYQRVWRDLPKCFSADAAPSRPPRRGGATGGAPAATAKRRGA
jgi:hypothetical protein